MFADIDGIPSHDLLNGWQWLVPSSAVVHRATANNGRLRQVARSVEDLDRLLDDTSFRRSHLYTFVVRAQVQKGKTLKPRQCYSLHIPLHLSGDFGPGNIDVADIVTHLSILGQLHRQKGSI